MSKVEFSPLCKCLSDELTYLDPDEQWTREEICEEAVHESWNLDEFSEEGYMALKHLFIRLMVPKEHWKDVDFDKFLNIVKQKYHERFNEDD